MKMTCARTAPDNRVAAWDRNSLFFIVPNIFNRSKVKDKKQKEKDKSLNQDQNEKWKVKRRKFKSRQKTKVKRQKSKCKMQIVKCKSQKVLKSNPLLGGARGGLIWVKDKS